MNQQLFSDDDNEEFETENGDQDDVTTKKRTPSAKSECVFVLINEIF